jgi:hypothetical protein
MVTVGVETINKITSTDKIIAINNIIRADFSFDFRPGFQWQINDAVYTNSDSVVIEIARENDGYKRGDIAVLDTNNNIVYIKGIHDQAVAIYPVVPPNTLQIASWIIDQQEVTITIINPSLPSMLGNANKFLKNNGNGFFWGDNQKKLRIIDINDDYSFITNEDVNFNTTIISSTQTLEVLVIDSTLFEIGITLEITNGMIKPFDLAILNAQINGDNNTGIAPLFPYHKVFITFYEEGTVGMNYLSNQNSRKFHGTYTSDASLNNDFQVNFINLISDYTVKIVPRNGTSSKQHWISQKNEDNFVVTYNELVSNLLFDWEISFNE